MNPKPQPQRRAPPKAIIYLNMWDKKGRRLWAFHNEEKIYFNRSEDARQWATKHGFDGIKIISPE